MDLNAAQYRMGAQRCGKMRKREATLANATRANNHVRPTLVRTGNTQVLVMPTKISISLLLVVFVVGCSGMRADGAAAEPQSLSVRLSSGQEVRVAVERDGTVLPDAKPKAIERVAEIKDVAVVIVDTYPSIPLGLSYCHAGGERFLRVISLRENPPRETFRLKLESCRDNIELASPGLEWGPDAAKLTIQWLQGPTMHKRESRTLDITNMN